MYVSICLCTFNLVGTGNRSKGCAVRYTLTSSGIIVVVNGRCGRRHIGSAFLITGTWASTLPMSPAPVFHCIAIHQTAEHVHRPCYLLWSCWFIRFWPAIETIPVMLRPQHCKCELTVTALYSFKLQFTNQINTMSVWCVYISYIGDKRKQGRKTGDSN